MNEVLETVCMRLIWIAGFLFWPCVWIESLHNDVMQNGYALPHTYLVAFLSLLWVGGGYWVLASRAEKPDDEGAGYRAFVEGQNAHGKARLASAQEFNALNNARSPFDEFNF